MRYRHGGAPLSLAAAERDKWNGARPPRAGEETDERPNFQKRSFIYDRPVVGSCDYLLTTDEIKEL